MAYTKVPRTKVEISRNTKNTYEERTTLFGLVKWWVKVSAEKVSDDLFIETDWEVDKIYLNGKELSRDGIKGLIEKNS